jgi:hypothetical protein
MIASRCQTIMFGIASFTRVGQAPAGTLMSIRITRAQAQMTTNPPAMQIERK